MLEAMQVHDNLTLTAEKGDFQGTATLDLTLTDANGKTLNKRFFKPVTNSLRSAKESAYVTSCEIQHIALAVGTYKDLEQAVTGKTTWNDQVSALVPYFNERKENPVRAKVFIRASKEGKVYPELPRFNLYDHKDTHKSKPIEIDGKKFGLINKPFVVAQDDPTSLTFDDYELDRAKDIQAKASPDNADIGVADPFGASPVADAQTEDSLPFEL